MDTPGIIDFILLSMHKYTDDIFLKRYNTYLPKASYRFLPY